MPKKSIPERFEDGAASFAKGALLLTLGVGVGFVGMEALGFSVIPDFALPVAESVRNGVAATV